MKNPVDLFKKNNKHINTNFIMNSNSSTTNITENDDCIYETNVKYEIRIDEYPPETELTKHIPFYRPNSLACNSPIVLEYVNTLQEVFDIIFEHPNGNRYYLFPSEECKKKAREELKKGYNTCYRAKDPFAVGNKNHIMTVYKAIYE